MGPPLHSAHPYSMRGRMTAVYILFIAGEQMVPSRRRRIPIIRAQAVYTLEIWSLHVRDSLSTSPRCLWVRTCGMGTPLIDTGGLCLALFPIERCLLFGALNSIPHLSAQVAAASFPRPVDSSANLLPFFI